MDLSKSYEFFKPETCDARIHIIGCGSVGSTVADLLARFGLTNITLYDFDKVEAKNIVNQMFTSSDIGMDKVQAVANHLIDINPEIKNTIKLREKGYTEQKLSGYVFLCVDNIELRRKIVEDNLSNPFVKGMFDFRTRLTDAQHYAADWTNLEHRTALLDSMQFSSEEAQAETPVSACGVSLCVAPTVRVICNAGVCNFINLLRGEHLYKCVLIDAFGLTMDAMG